MKHYYKSFFLRSLILGITACTTLSAWAQNSADFGSQVKGDAGLKVPSTGKQGLNKTVSPLNDHLPFPVPAFSKTNPLAAGVQLGPAGAQSQALRPLASLSITGIEVSAKIVDASLKGLMALRLSVKNNTDRPLNFNGNEIIATVGNAQLKAVPMSAISDFIHQPDNPKGYLRRSIENTVTATLTVGTLQTVEGELTRHGSIAGRYGFDNANRIDRLGRFSERILWPGDSSEGLVYFKTNESLAGAAIQVPVADFYNKKDNTTAVATVKQ